MAWAERKGELRIRIYNGEAINPDPEPYVALMLTPVVLIVLLALA